MIVNEQVVAVMQTDVFGLQGLAFDVLYVLFFGLFQMTNEPFYGFLVFVDIAINCLLPDYLKCLRTGPLDFFIVVRWILLIEVINNMLSQGAECVSERVDHDTDAPGEAGHGNIDWWVAYRPVQLGNCLFILLRAQRRTHGVIPRLKFWICGVHFLRLLLRPCSLTRMLD